jgi:hypothetical protein
MSDDREGDRSASAPEPVTLPLRCQWCGKDVALTYQPTNQYRSGAWSCPYWACQKIQKIDLQGSIVRVVVR